MSFTLSGKTWWDNDIHKKKNEDNKDEMQKQDMTYLLFLQY